MLLTLQLATNIRVHLGQPGLHGQNVVLSVILEPSLVTASAITVIRETTAVRVKLLSWYPAQMLFASSGLSGLNGHRAVSPASAEFGIENGNVLVKLDLVKAYPVKQVTVTKETVPSGQIGVLPVSALSPVVAVSLREHELVGTGIPAWAPTGKQIRAGQTLVQVSRHLS